MKILRALFQTPDTNCLSVSLILQLYIGIWEPKSDYCSVLQFEGIHKEHQSLNLNIELFSMEAQMWWQNVP